MKKKKTRKDTRYETKCHNAMRELETNDGLVSFQAGEIAAELCRKAYADGLRAGLRRKEFRADPVDAVDKVSREYLSFADYFFSD